MIWLLATGLALLALILHTYHARVPVDERRDDLGYVSPQWIHEFRARGR